MSTEIVARPGRDTEAFRPQRLTRIPQVPDERVSDHLRRRARRRDEERVGGRAHADPCEGRLPDRAGETFSGVVRYVGDGDSLCVGPGTDPATWIEVRLSDFDAPELHSPTGRAARERLSSLARGRVLSCVAVRGRSGRVIVHDRVIGAFHLEGLSVGDLLRMAGGREGGN